MKTSKFLINIADSDLLDLNSRLAQTRWPDPFNAPPWEFGTPRSVLQRAVTFWRDEFDWRSAERALNRLPQFQAEIRGLRIHFMHIKGVDPNSTPIVLTHGWPGSFAEMYRVVPMLTDPASHGLPGFPSFDVVVPSLPGFGFSQAPTGPGTNSAAIAGIWHELMTGLGYQNYFAQGGDIGAGVSSWLARLYPEAILGLHLNFIPGSFQPSLSDDDRPLSVVESAWLAKRQEWIANEGGYSHLQSTKPETLGYALTDSPAGLAAWMLEKFYGWSDGDGELATRFDMFELLTNISLYWFSRNVTSSLRIYRENASLPMRFGFGERIQIPMSFAKFPKEIVTPPREWVERVFNVVRWTEMKSGGHFAALENPKALARDIHESFLSVR